MPKFKSNLERDFHRTFKLPYEPVALPYVVTHRYTPDFQVSANAYIETKGMFVGADRSKHLQVKKQHPHIEVLFVFQEPNRRLSKASRTTYSQWCEAKGFAWCSSKDTEFIAGWIERHR